MADRIPLIVDSSSNQIKELPDGDSITLGDSENIKFGDGDDARIFSDGSNGYMRGFLALQNSAGNKDFLSAADGGATTIHHNNSAKIATTATGVSVTGNVIYSGGSLTAEAALGDGATVNWDVTANPVAKVTIAGNRTLALPDNPLGSGQYASLLVIQDGTGSRTLTWNAAYEFKDDTAPTLTTTASKGDLFTFRYNGAKWLEVGRNQNLSLS